MSYKEKFPSVLRGNLLVGAMEDPPELFQLLL